MNRRFILFAVLWLRFGVPDGAPMRCSDGYGPSAIMWAARKDGMCYESDRPEAPR